MMQFLIDSEGRRKRRSDGALYMRNGSSSSSGGCCCEHCVSIPVYRDVLGPDSSSSSSTVQSALWSNYRGIVPRFIKIRIEPQSCENSSSSCTAGGIASPFDNTEWVLEIKEDEPFASNFPGGAWPTLDGTKRAQHCSNAVYYCGKFTVDMTVPKLDGSGDCHITDILFLVSMYVWDDDMRGECWGPRYITEILISVNNYVETPVGTCGGIAYVGHWVSGGQTTSTGRWLSDIPFFLGYPVLGTPYVPTFQPDTPILVSPVDDETCSGMNPICDYLYPKRNRVVYITCTPDSSTSATPCGGSLPSSSSSSWSSSSSSGASSSSSGGGSSSSSGGGSSSSSSSSGGGEGDPCLNPRLCGSDELQEDLLYDFIGVDDGQVWKHSDGRCVYADLHGTEIVYGTANLDTSNPQVSCIACYGESLCFYANGTGRKTLINKTQGKFTATVNLHWDVASIYNGTHDLFYLNEAPPGGYTQSCTVWVFGKDIEVSGTERIEFRLYATGVYFGSTRWYIIGRHLIYDIDYYEYNEITEEYDIPVYGWIEQCEYFQFGNESYELIFGASTDEFPTTIDPTYTGSNSFYQIPNWECGLAYVGSAPEGHGIEITLTTGDIDGIDVCEDCEDEPLP